MFANESSGIYRHGMIVETTHEVFEYVKLTLDNLSNREVLLMELYA